MSGLPDLTKKEAIENPGPESKLDIRFAEVRFPIAARDDSSVNMQP